MRKRLAVQFAAIIFLSREAQATVSVEQIEAFEDTTSPQSHYAPIDFGGSSTVTPSSGTFSGVTFHALSGTTSTLSSHAAAVGGSIYGTGSPGSGYVTDVYAANTNTFFGTDVLARTAVSNSGPVPAHFASGVQIVNSSFVAADTANLDDLRRIDFMINRDDVTYIASATNSGALSNDDLTWSSFNSLAVRGDLDGIDPSGSPGKTHVDLGLAGHTSFTAAIVSGDAAGLYGHAQAAGQSAAQHGVVMRSLLMAGADKTTYTRQTANNLDTQWGAGEPNFNTSLSILQAGQKTLNTVSGGNISATAATGTAGWSFGTINAGGETAVVFHVDDPIATVTASLNWNVTQSQPNASLIDTTDAGTIFPDLALELRPVTFTSGHYVLGAASTDTTLQSNAANDNVEYLYSTNPLPAGDYAFLISGDAGLSTAAGFSYNLFVPPVSRWSASAGGSWATAGNWSIGTPNAALIRATFGSSPGITTASTITLDGSRTVGQITFNNAHGYTINPGSGGTLTIDDTGDGGGPRPSITVSAGSHTIAVPVALPAGVTVNTAASTALTISKVITGAGGLTKIGAGALTLTGNAADSFGDTTVNAGTLTIAAGTSLASAMVTAINGSTLNVNGSLASTVVIDLGGTGNFAGNTGTGPFTRTLAALNLGPGSLVNVTPSVSAATPAILSINSIAFADTSEKIDLTNNELLTTATLASMRPRVTSREIFTTAAGGTLGYMDAGGGVTEVRFTLPGDTNLDGSVNSTDLGNVANSYGVTTAANWSQGDFDYNGTVDIADLGDMATSYNTALPAAQASIAAIAGATPAASASVPEPGGIGAIGLASLAWLTNRRRARVQRHCRSS